MENNFRRKCMLMLICHEMYAVQYLLLWSISCIRLLTFGCQKVCKCLFGSDVHLSNSPNDVYSEIQTLPSRVPWLSFSKLFVGALVITHGRVASALASHYCAENQTAELGQQGIIECNFPDNFYRVIWFEDISVNSSFVISCVAPCNVKNGPGFRSKDYDVFHNGSLSIPRVTATHERSYEVVVYTPAATSYFEKLIVFLKVIALPTELLFSLDGSDIHQKHYQSINGEETLTCFVNSARPPVHLEWIEETPNGDIVLEHLENIIDENENGTFSSLVSLHLSSTKHKLMTLLVCRAKWMQQDWKRENKILLDNSGLESFTKEPKKVLYFEINRRVEIRCEGSKGFVKLWKRILPNNSVDLIGFSLDGATEVMTNSQGITISPEGSLVFSSPDVDHEGTYVCVNSYGMQNITVYVTDFTILIPPSPPYIQIEGCEDAMESCTLQGSDNHQLVCSVVGVRPAVTLEWIASNSYEGKITFLNQKSVTEKHSQTSDVTLSTEYELVSEHSNCGDSVFIKCRLLGPVSHIMKSERTIILDREACQVDQDEEGGVSSLPVVLAVCFGGLFFVTCVLLGACIKAYMVLKRTFITTDSEESIPMNGHKYSERTLKIAESVTEQTPNSAA